MWVIMDPLSDNVQLNFAKTIISRSLAAAEDADEIGANTSASDDSSADHAVDDDDDGYGGATLDCPFPPCTDGNTTSNSNTSVIDIPSFRPNYQGVACGSRGKVTFGSEPACLQPDIAQLQANRGKCEIVLTAPIADSASQWFHMVGFDLPPSIFQSSNPLYTGWLVKLTGNMIDPTTGNFPNGSEVIAVLTADGVWITDTAGSAFRAIQNYAGTRGLGDPNLPKLRPLLPSQPIMGLHVSRSTQDDSPVVVVASAGFMFRANTRACNCSCVAGRGYADGCHDSPWDNTCSACSSCVYGLEMIERPCSTGASYSTNLDTACRGCEYPLVQLQRHHLHHHFLRHRCLRHRSSHHSRRRAAAVRFLVDHQHDQQHHTHRICHFSRLPSTRTRAGSACAPGEVVLEVCNFENDTSCGIAPPTPVNPIQPAVPRPIIDQSGLEAWRITALVVAVASGVVATALALRSAAAGRAHQDRGGKTTGPPSGSSSSSNSSDDGHQTFRNPFKRARVAEIMDAAADNLMEWRFHLMNICVSVFAVVAQIFWAIDLSVECARIGYCTDTTIAIAYSVISIYIASSLVFVPVTARLLSMLSLAACGETAWTRGHARQRCGGAQSSRLRPPRQHVAACN